MTILSASTAVVKPEPDKVKGRRPLTWMSGDRVIEVTNAGQPAWLVQPQPLVNDSIAFDIAMAYIFKDWCEARDTVSRLQCGYPQWHCQAVRYSEEYRLKYALPISEQEQSAKSASLPPTGHCPILPAPAIQTP